LKNADLADRFKALAAIASERLIAEIDRVGVDKLATVAAVCVEKQLLLTNDPRTTNEPPE
jgi:hypothetical protein